MCILIGVIQSNISNSEAYYFKNIADNWSLKPIDSLNLNSCDNTKNILQEKWRGTRSGCNCFTYIQRGSCSKRSFCTRINGKSQIQFTFWRGNSICTERETHGKYLSLNIERNSESCPSGKRSCGIIDSQNNHLCLDNNLSCPVVDIKFSENGNNSITGKDGFLNDNNKTKNLDSNDYIYNVNNADLIYSKNEKKLDTDVNKLYIPIQFKIANDQPCLNPYFENMNFQLYLLDVLVGKQMCLRYTNENDFPKDDDIIYDQNNPNNPKNDSGNNVSTYQDNFSPNNGILIYDNHYREIDKYFMESLYIENGITAVTYNLPLFPKTIYKRDIYLYSKNYFGLKIDCLKNIQKENLSDKILEDTLNVTNFLADNTTLTISLIFGVITFILYIFMLLTFGPTINNKNHTKKNGQNSNFSRCLFLSISLSLFVMILGYLIPIIIISSNSKINTKFDQIFSDSNCVDDYTLELYNRFAIKKILVRNMNIACIALSSSGFVINFIYFITVCFKTNID